MDELEDPVVVIQSIFAMADEQVKEAKDIMAAGPSVMGVRSAQVHATLANYYAMRAQVFMTAAGHAMVVGPTRHPMGDVV